MPQQLSLEDVLGGEPVQQKAKEEEKSSKSISLSLDEVTAGAVSAEDRSNDTPAWVDAYVNSPVNKFVNKIGDFIEEDVVKPAGNLVASLLLKDKDLPEGAKPSTVMKDFGDKALETASKTGELVVNDLREGNINRPFEAGVKAITGGAADLLDTANKGLNFLYNMAQGQEPRKALKSAENLSETGPTVRKLVEATPSVILGQVQKINLSPKNEVEKSMQEFLGLLPGSVFAAGEDVYQRTGSVFLAAGVETFGTLLTLKPSIAGKILKSTPLAAEGLAVKDPKALNQLAEHVAEADPALAKELQKTAEKAKTITPEKAEALGEKIVEAGFKKVGETAEGKPRVRAAEKVVEEAKPKIEPTVEDIARDTADQGKIEQGLTAVAQEITQTAKEPVKIEPAIETKPVEKAAPITLDPVFKEAKALVEANPEQAITKLKEELGLNDAKAAKVVEQVEKEKAEAAKPQVEDSVVYRADTGEAVTERQVRQAFTVQQAGIPIPGADFVVGKLKAYFNEIQRLVAPEALGPKAKSAAAATAKNIAKQMRSDVQHFEMSKGRRDFWEASLAEVSDFVKRFETGQLQKNPILQAAADHYKVWNEVIYLKEKLAGIVYEAVDNYLYHAFEDSTGVSQFLEKKYGPKWNQPGFMKDRTFEMYEAAEKAGYKPRYKNPEDIMLARQHASDVALMRVETLKDLHSWGLAKEITVNSPDAPPGWNAVKWKSPNGTKYWVHEHAAQILHNAFETKSLWTMEGARGDAFRGAMFLKNVMVSVQLSLSGFHALHVMTLDNATAMVRSTKELLSGNKNPVAWLGDIIQGVTYGAKGIPFKALYDNPSFGGRLVKAYEGKISHSQLTAAEQQMMVFMTEGGFIPHLSAQYKFSALESFKKAIRENTAAGVAKATLWSPFAAIQLLQKPMMEIWIPRLKAASYARDIQTALKTDPTLLQDSQRRIVAFHKLAKSIDNRYGEMAYNTLFWNRMIKDLGVANTLSLGWQLGFLREYGGGAMDLKQFATEGSTIPKKIKTGLLDRPMFLAFYTGQSLMYGGLMTYLLSGSQPETLEDYIFPKNGETKPDGTPERVNTMYYVKEFASINKRMQIDGVAGGLTHVVESKASGVVGAVGEWVTGLNSMGQEVRDPNAPAYIQLQQSLAYTLGRMEPISMKAVRESDRSVKSAVMGVAGFSPAPKYIAESVIEGKIKGAYQKYNTAKQAPYEKVQLSNERRELQRLYDSGDMQKYDEKFDQVVEKFKLTSKEEAKLTNSIGNKDQGEASLTMFKSLPWQRQKVLLDQMNEEEREKYLPVSNKAHLRYDYEPPVEKQQ